MKDNSFILTGELLVGKENSDFNAIKYAKRLMRAKIGDFENAMKDFGLKVGEIYVTGLECMENTDYIVSVAIDGTCQCTQEELQTFIKKNTYELHGNINGIAPYTIDVTEQQKVPEYNK